MNLNQLAKEICLIEGKKKEVNIAQVKEVLRCLGDILFELDSLETIKTIEKIIKRSLAHR
ncbi:MAG: hypothetical protein ACE5DN_04310 [Flavobacteriales bacterium]